MANDLLYSEDIGKKIVSLLDGWAISEFEEENITSKSIIDPFLSNEPIRPNKIITHKELETFYDNAVIKALIYLSRVNVDDFSCVELKMFNTGICYIAASDIWQKYNIRVTNEDMSDTFIQSYGGLLYNQGIQILDNFLEQKITGLIRQSNNDEWIL